MIKSHRSVFNQEFTPEKYKDFLRGLASEYNCMPKFRVAETPIFIPKILQERLIEACEEINATLMLPDFKELTKDAIKHPMVNVPNEDDHSRFIQFDFGVCLDENGDPFPMLIELQGFPSLYYFQDLLSRKYKEYFNIPKDFTNHVNGLTRDKYLAMLKKEIVGDSKPKNVVLLEVEPEKQTTYIDLLVTSKLLGIKILCVSELKKEGKTLFYIDESGEKVKVERIYNRVIFDELDQRADLKREFYFEDEVDVHWVGHPNWFFRISKYTMPFLKSKYVPETRFLSEVKQYPADLENYVLKPLYSFAGSGVKINITKADLDEISDKENFILQKKVAYAPIIETMDVPAKCEIRMMTLWNDAEQKAQVVNNLVRLSKGEMIGVRYNKDKDWVGGSVGFFEN
ncbi:MAG: hypothetical protein ACJASP_001439 [Roseivirga sp.]|jgi:hypothetical protein